MDYTMDMGGGNFHAKVFYGTSQMTTTGPTGVSAVDLIPIFGGSLLWEGQKWRFRLGCAEAKVDSQMGEVDLLTDWLQYAESNGWPEAGTLAEEMDSVDDNFYYYSVGAAYDGNPWKIQSEVSLTDSDFDSFQQLISAYLSVAYCIGPVQVYGVGGLAKNTEDRVRISSAPEQWALLEQGAQQYRDRIRIDQKSTSLGLRWDIHSNIALKLQWDHHWVDAYGGLLWYQEATLVEDNELDTYSLNLNFIF